jgi:hypothetical protein
MCFFVLNFLFILYNIYLFTFVFKKSWWEHCLWIYLKFFMIYASRLRFCEPFFQCGFLCLFFVVCFSQPDVVNITWITGHIHRSIVDKIEPTSKNVEMVKKIPYQWHQRINLHCLQLISIKTLFTAHTKKTTKNIGEEKSTINKIQNNPPVPSITPLFNLLALRNKFNQKSVLTFFMI